jgi:GNAT superfamily N-acetyltransferase
MADREWITEQLHSSWGSTTVISRGQAYDAAQLPALVALDGDQRVGLATFRHEGAERELITLDAFRKHSGIGSVLLERVSQEAADRGCARL